MDASTNTTEFARSSTRYLVVAAIVLGAFLGAYGFALARTGSASSTNAAGIASAANAGSAGAGQGQPGGNGVGAGGSGCACCGSSAPTEGGITGDVAEGNATVTDGIQEVEVDLSRGYYQPNQLVLKAGVPADITFGQGSGCTAQVASNELGFFEDVSSGPKTVRLPALEKGEYPFYCGMQMVFGKIVVK